MNFPSGIHPCKTFPSNQDASLRRNSSLQDISIKSGCISPPEFIPARHFHQIRMHPVAEKLSVPRKHPGSLAPRKLMSQFPPIPPSLSFHQKTHTSVSANKSPVSASTRKRLPQLPPISPQPQLLPASSASISALTASTIPESSRMRSLSIRLMGTEMENAYRDPPSSESAAAMQRTPASFSSLSSA